MELGEISIKHRTANSVRLSEIKHQMLYWTGRQASEPWGEWTLPRCVVRKCSVATPPCWR